MLIYLTDLEGDAGDEPAFPVLWALPEGKAEAPWGKIERERHAFGQHLADEAPARRSQRQPRRDLLPLQRFIKTYRICKKLTISL